MNKQNELIEELCQECNGTGYFEIKNFEPITHDMANDAGDPNLEGQHYYYLEKIECEACGGSGIILTKGKKNKNG